MFEEIKHGDEVFAQAPETGESSYYEVVCLTNPHRRTV
jgi:hypothetical protein